MSDILSAYTLADPVSIDELTKVGRGTRMGELLRRYWHPVGLARDASRAAREIKVLGEKLILFRDALGRPGLLYPRCAHRGASLLYGKTEERGIRCCYHGWLYDVNGHCLEQPCERNGGARTSGRIRQPGYPLEERYGLVFAYLGPPEKQPILPRYEVFETLTESESIETDDSSIGSGGPTIVPCNWLQHFENVMDPFHVPILHSSFSGNQFFEQMAIMPAVTFAESPRGVKSVQLRALGDGTAHCRVTEAVLPTVRAVANPRAEETGPCSLLGWVLPIDDTTFRIYSVGRVAEKGALGKMRSQYAGKQWHELTEEEHRAMPGDYEAQVSQGPITAHSEEHLVSSDRGIGMLRRLFRRQLATIAADGSPINTCFGTEDAIVKLDAGTSIVETHSQAG